LYVYIKYGIEDWLRGVTCGNRSGCATWNMRVCTGNVFLVVHPADVLT